MFRRCWLPMLLLAAVIPSAGCRTSTIAANGTLAPQHSRLPLMAERFELALPRRTDVADVTPSPEDREIRQTSAVESARDPVTAPDLVRVPARVSEHAATTAAALLLTPANVERQSLALTVFQAVETALSQNPDLVAQRQAEGVSAAALGVAQTYPFNPWVQVQATPFQDLPGGRAGTTSHYVLLMQQIQLARQQDYREQGASAQLNSVRWNILQAELLTVAQTQRLYFTALYLQGLRDLARATSENNQQLLGILERQLNAGQATAADVAMVRLDARSTQQQLRLADAQYQTALFDLRRQLGLPPDVPMMLTTDFSMRAASVGSNPLSTRYDESSIGTLAAGRPDVQAARADIDFARANSSLADASRVPDLQVGPYYQRTFDGSSLLGFRAQMDIPVLNNGMPLLRQREAEFHQRTMVWQQLQTRAELETQAALDRYHRACALLSDVDTHAAEANAVEASAVAALPQELQRLEELFKAGEIDVLRVFQARNSLIQSRRAVLDSLNEVTQAAAALTAATGLPIEDVLAVPK